MKKLNVLLAIGLVALGAMGCGSSPNNDSVTNTAEASGQQAGNADTQITNNVQNAGRDEMNRITVNSSEKVTVVPDIAEIVYSVRTEAREAAACQQQNAEAVSGVIELLKSLNIPETSIQTSDYHMNPIYDYSGKTARVTGYEAAATLTVSDLPIENLDNILSQSVSTGVNTIQSITYKASKYDESYRQALTAAVSSAREKAQALAEAAGCSVGDVVSIQETSGYSEARYTDNALTNQYRSAMKEMAVEDSAGAVMPGEIQVEAGIIVTYRLK